MNRRTQGLILSEAVDGFTKYKVVEGLSPRTLESSFSIVFHDVKVIESCPPCFLKVASLFCYNLLMTTPDPISDTSPEAEAVLIALLRQAPAWHKFKMVGDLNATVRQFALAGIRARHPNATEREQNRYLADLLLGED